jgi:hypothetical protein
MNMWQLFPLSLSYQVIHVIGNLFNFYVDPTEEYWQYQRRLTYAEKCDVKFIVA